MASPNGILGPHTMWLLLGIATAAVLAMQTLRSSTPPDESRAEITVGEGEHARVVRIDRRECLSRGNRVWATIDDGAECIAYVTAGQPSGSALTLVYFSGDIPATQLGERSQTAMREFYAKRAAALAQSYDVPVIVVARPGTMGSSGYHLAGGRSDEAKVMASAIDALKNQFGIRRLALAGQSGGARVIAQLMVMGRNDIQCAAMASGAYGLPRLVGGGTTRTNIFGDPGRRYLVPLRNADAVVHDERRRSFVIGDRRDQRTPFSEQQEWADRLRTPGHHAVLIEATAKGSEHHGLSSQALLAGALCAGGRSDAEIRTAVMAPR